MDEYIDYNTGIDEKFYADSLPYSEGVQLAAHNSFSSVEDGFIHHPQQHFDVKHQFKFGARGFMVDVYNSPNDHTLLLHNQDLSFLSGIGSSATKTFYFEDYLEDIHYLLQKYHKSVITLIIENGKSVDSAKIRSALDNIGLSKYLLIKDPNDKEVTFGHMRNLDERLVVFLENGHKTPTNNIYTTAYYKETTYSLEKDSQCVDRKEGRVPFHDDKISVFVLNHFYTKSCDRNLGVTSLVKHSCSEANDYNKIVARFDLCKNEGNVPTFIATDFIEQGDNGGPLKAIEYANNLSGGSTSPSISSHNLSTTSHYFSGYINLEKIIIFIAGFATLGIQLLIYKKCAARTIKIKSN